MQVVDNYERLFLNHYLVMMDNQLNPNIAIEVFLLVPILVLYKKFGRILKIIH